VVVASDLVWQASLFAQSAPAVEVSFDGLVRHQLDADVWVDHVPGWLAGSDGLFEWMLHEIDWDERDRPMYGRIVHQPRLTHHWGDDLPLPMAQIRDPLVAHYHRPFDAVGANLYRDGRDSVAWHGDRIALTVANPLVATISLGHRRRFLLRPRTGGRSRVFEPDKGDLLVMGGACQRTWQHAVPKVAAAGPRISITVRHSV
jgi:alkylated DNA repair dioxygenase AlkB